MPIGAAKFLQRRLRLRRMDIAGRQHHAPMRRAEALFSACSRSTAGIPLMRLIPLHNCLCSPPWAR
jgi:hypothetical protein